MGTLSKVNTESPSCTYSSFCMTFCILGSHKSQRMRQSGSGRLLAVHGMSFLTRKAMILGVEPMNYGHTIAACSLSLGCGIVKIESFWILLTVTASRRSFIPLVWFSSSFSEVKFHVLEPCTWHICLLDSRKSFSWSGFCLRHTFTLRPTPETSVKQGREIMRGLVYRPEHGSPF